MGYTPSFTPAYEGGWEDLPLETTPITAEALNAYDDAIENIEGYLASDASQANLADSYDPDEGTYAVGDYAIYEGTLYKCTTPVSEPEDFDSDKWESCLITDEMGHGGGGSDVSITPTLSTGTKIADFEIDGVEGELYAPTGGGGNANIWTGTQAELEEVFDELEEGTQINITDDEQEVVEGGTIYSEEEQCIGLWTDNKPLYQKTIDTGGLPNNTTNNVNHGISNLGDVVNVFGVAIAPNVNKIPLPFIATGGTNEQVCIFVNPTTISVRTGQDKTAYTQSRVTVQYTKSTDAPLDAVVGKRTMYIASSDCYSTEEKEIGCWTDGKPLYQKTVDCGALPANTTKNVAHGITNIDRIVSVSGCAFRSTSGNEAGIPIPSTHYQTIGNQNEISVNFTNVVLRNGNSSASAFDKTQVTIQYTKTTDVAGSGTYTPASGKAVHYSTDEQVIGTWVDGSTLYRKTFTGLSTATNGTSWVVVDGTAISGANQIISADIYRTASGALTKMPIAECQIDSTTSKLKVSIVASSFNGSINVATVIYTKSS